jgi:hypothetical protein
MDSIDTGLALNCGATRWDAIAEFDLIADYKSTN